VRLNRGQAISGDAVTGSCLFVTAKLIGDEWEFGQIADVTLRWCSRRMQVLVDFDNLTPATQQQGTVYVADKVFQSLAPVLALGQRLELRVYGGWDHGGRLTPRAQRLRAELAASFPRVFNLVGGSPPVPIVTTATLARSLLIEPMIPLTDTYRLRPPPRRMFCDSPAAHGCVDPACPLVAVAHFIMSRNCPTAQCPIEFETIVTGHSQQKVVDTAIVSDLIELSANKEKEVAVLTSDDDIWPGMASAMHNGTLVYHIDARGQGPSRYAKGHRPLYRLIPF